jgi:hypothetical protein
MVQDTRFDPTNCCALTTALTWVQTGYSNIDLALLWLGSSEEWSLSLICDGMLGDKLL